MDTRFDRQKTLVNQELLSLSTVSVVGIGGLGTHTSTSLVGLGLKELRLYDYDKVEIENLNRQNYDETDVGKPKAPAYAEKLRRWNSLTSISGYYLQINERTIDGALRDSNVLVDATDNYSTRVLLNKYAVRKRTPLVSGGMSGLRAHVVAYDPQRGNPCVDCKLDIVRLDKKLKEERKRQRAAHCDRTTVPSVATISMIIGGLMGEQVRKILAPVNENDKPLQGILKYDATLKDPFIFIPTKKRESCKCVI
jgi:molybdopterin/thiamine biosynthesis adenylyltransferase